MENISQPKEDKFLIAQMADDLVDLTIRLVDKRESKAEKELREEAKKNGEVAKKPKRPKFPNFLYDTYVDEIISSALEIQKTVILANEEYSNGSPERRKLGKHAIGLCVLLNHMVRLSYDKGWVNEKERDKWQSLITGLRWKIYNWIK